jgi:competence protein ComGC
MMKKGVSLIQLVIIISIMLILTVPAVMIGNNYISRSKTAALDSTISGIKRELSTYRQFNGELPVVKDEEGRGIIFDLTKELNLKKVLDTSNDAGDVFYILDISKIGAINAQKGKDIGNNDIFIVASKSENVYYVKGEILNNQEKYHGRVESDIDNGVIGYVTFNESDESKFNKEDESKIEYKDGVLLLKLE